MKAELKPCPFCGEEPVLDTMYPYEPMMSADVYEHLTGDLLFYSGGAFIECSCGASIMRETKNDVIEAWNRREER